MSSLSTEKVHINFPHKILPHIKGEPTYEAIHKIMMSLYTNTVSVPTTPRGGGHGHMGLVMGTYLYAALSTMVYTAPTAPVRTTLSTRAQLVDRNTADAKYLGVTSKDMINHPLDRYGKITSSDLTNNAHQFNEAINLLQHINTYFTQVDDCIQFAMDVLQKWKAKAEVDKTWPNFKKFFADVYAELCKEEQLTTKESSFQQANVIQEESTALEHLANVAVAERESMQVPISANKQLTGNNKILAEQIKKLEGSFLQMHSLVKEVHSNKNNNCNNGRQKQNWDQHGYCWRCGYRVTKDHNS
eukprot:11456629-Ditylum_brightwellii.AAC.1